MGYRSDLAAAKARSNALEKDVGSERVRKRDLESQLAAEREAHEALRGLHASEQSRSEGMRASLKDQDRKLKRTPHLEQEERVRRYVLVIGLVAALAMIAIAILVVHYF